MKNDLRFLQYCTIYSYSKKPDIQNAKEVSVLTFLRSICFFEAFHAISEDTVNIYKVFICTDNSLLAKRWANKCFVDENTIIKHIKQLTLLLPEIRSFSIERATFKNASGYNVTIVVSPTKVIINKYILTWIRYLYEPSFSLAVLDAQRLLKLPQFRFISYENILNIVLGCFSRKIPNYNTWHAIGTMRPVKIYTRSQIYKSLNEIAELNDLYPKLPIEDKKVNDLHIPTVAPVTDSEFWLSDEDFKNVRLPKYLELLNLLVIH